jgi:hypothetical protein
MGLSRQGRLAVMLDLARRGALLARWWPGLGIAATMAAKVAHGIGNGPVGATVLVACCGGGKEGCRLRHLGAVLPCEVRVLGGLARQPVRAADRIRGNDNCRHA